MNTLPLTQGSEEGFTLVELLVVIAIIAILTAIAVPSFLKQREKGYEAATASDLRATSMVLVSEHLDDFSADLGTVANDAPRSAGVQMDVAYSENGFCLAAWNEKGGKYESADPLVYDSLLGTFTQPSEGRSENCDYGSYGGGDDAGEEGEYVGGLDLQLWDEGTTIDGDGYVRSAIGLSPQGTVTSDFVEPVMLSVKLRTNDNYEQVDAGESKVVMFSSVTGDAMPIELLVPEHLRGPEEEGQSGQRSLWFEYEVIGSWEGTLADGSAYTIWQ